MRLLGYLALLLAIGALVLDVLAMGDAEFGLRSLNSQIADLGLTDMIAPYNADYVAVVLGLPGVLVLGGLGIVLLIISSLFSRGE